MSDTPEIDAVAFDPPSSSDGWRVYSPHGYCVDADFARDLVRQHKRAKERLQLTNMALAHIIATLKTHHMTRPGISTLVRNAEKMIFPTTENK